MHEVLETSPFHCKKTQGYHLTSNAQQGDRFSPAKCVT